MNKDTYIIENSLIKKELHIKSNKIVGYSVVNNLSSKILKPSEGTEEFCLNFGKGLFKTKINCSELKIKSADCETTGEEKIHTITFKPVGIKNSEINIKLVYTVNDHSCYMRKHLEFTFRKRGDKEIILDSIDFEKLHFDGSLKFWTVPKQQDSHIPGFALSLGQPVYLDSLYMGSEFPAALNRVEDFTAKVSYYSGKSLQQLIGGDKYVTFKSVLGGSESDIFEQVQKSFFSYIKDISKPIRLRRQYNSWYDHMLNITRENITGSFLEIEKGMTKTGEAPLDSYVADDGWNDYTKGFWSFNEKFPDELYPFRNLAKGLGSDFGLWVGPRGGYTTDTIKFARHIQAHGNGYVNKSSQDICVASEKYVNRMSEMMVDFEKRFSLNYFKLDGFAQRPCKDKHHDHMTGGYKNMYFYSDVWEKWLKVFEQLNMNGSSNFWINLTCYASPSPWYLQWVNSLWMQISDDVGFIGKKKQVSDKDRMLSYRDERYFDFYQVRQFQFPQRALYNHDPIYGNTAEVSMTDGEFREYLFTMATRGTAFWELYYSYNMMNEAKWRINYAALRFIEENLDVLSNSVVFGGRPSLSKVYGYSCFSDYEGIVSVRNSSSEQQTFTFRLDEYIGVKKTFVMGKMYTVLPYTPKSPDGVYGYGDTVTVTLSPYETKIFHFGRRKKELKAEYVKARRENTLEVQFNQTVDASAITCAQNPVKDIQLLEDYMTVMLTFEKPFERMNSLTLSGVCDIMENTADIDVTFDYYENFIIKDSGIYGKTDFTVEANITAKEPKLLFRQGDEIELAVGDDGFVRFRVGACTLKSVCDIRDAVQITAVRERNNVMKLYFDKNLNAGMPSVSFELSGEKFTAGEGINVKVYNRALSYDEV